MSSCFSYIFHPHTVVLHQSIACLYHASMSSEEWFYSFVLWVQLDMAKSKKSKENNIVGSAVTRRWNEKGSAVEILLVLIVQQKVQVHRLNLQTQYHLLHQLQHPLQLYQHLNQLLVRLLRNWPVPKLPSHLTLLPKHCWHNRTWQDQMNLMSINTKTVPDRVKLQLHAPLYVLSQFDVH